jgi:hypothetical protein
MKIGVELRLDRDAGELFADARALEAAGVDSFWASGQDEIVLLAAIAALTFRARIAAANDDAPALRTLELLARGRLIRASPRGDERTVPAGDGQSERWRRVAFPTGRAAWKELRAKAEAEGIDGLILENDPRLLDLVRNPDVEDDRSDIKLAFG